MEPAAVHKATSRLETAQSALNDLESCNSFKRFTELWYTFLVAANGVYTVLEKGAKISPQSRQWFGGKKNFRRGDQLLQYLAQARDDDEHGLSLVLKHDETVAKVIVDIPQYKGPLWVKATYNPGETGSISIDEVGGKPVAPENKFPHVKLLQVRDRSGKAYDPPSEHLGVPILPAGGGDHPQTVAKLALAYLRKLVEDASKLL